MVFYKGKKTIISHGSCPVREFQQLVSKPGAIWLDSSLSFGDRGQSSFIACEPVLDISLQGQRVVIIEKDGRKSARIDADIFDVLESYWTDSDFFSVGYITYESSLEFLNLKSYRDLVDIPSVRFLFYDRVRQYHHSQNKLLSNEQIFNPEPCSVKVVPTLSHDDYCNRIRQIKDHIREGDIYQANFTTRFDVHSTAKPFDVYTRLRSLNPAPYSCYMNFGDYQILSSSPERMFLKTQHHITSCPIKGTIARSLFPERDIKCLLESEKDRAELLMIVDLVRNDLGRVAETGSVKVESLFRPEVYSSLIHLVSDIRAECRRDVTLTDILKALLPGGSITGAPKQRAVEIISELEPVPRSVYTGCIGYVYEGTADFNIAIRTMVHHNDVYQIHTGGGIVADSDPEEEYNEMFLKAGNLLKATYADRIETVCSKQ
ncbi:MAG: aminodeoxychorismate synthase component I [Candidatus Zixiibacteriota bacterium]|nr:MAG: aminodeoxychorismate synthase component I [candidate division Zixibacteria bacterium]